MLEFFAGFLTCAVLWGLHYVWLRYSQYQKSEAATLGRNLKAEAPTRHRGQSALGQGANLMSKRY